VAPDRVTLKPCEVPALASLGALTVEVKRVAVGEHLPVQGASLLVTNPGEQAITVTVARVEVVPWPRMVKAISATTFAVPGRAEKFERLVRFSDVVDPDARVVRLTVTSTDGRVAIAAPVVRSGFELEGR
jgi:hypothetical protein